MSAGGGEDIKDNMEVVEKAVKIIGRDMNFGRKETGFNFNSIC